jgi:hypothetical protein
MTLAHEEIIDFILAGKTRQEVIDFHASEGVKARVTRGRPGASASAPA